MREGESREGDEVVKLQTSDRIYVAGHMGRVLHIRGWARASGHETGGSIPMTTSNFPGGDLIIGAASVGLARRGGGVMPAGRFSRVRAQVRVRVAARRRNASPEPGATPSPSPGLRVRLRLKPRLRRQGEEGRGAGSQNQETEGGNCQIPEGKIQVQVQRRGEDGQDRVCCQTQSHCREKDCSEGQGKEWARQTEYEVRED